MPEFYQLYAAPLSLYSGKARAYLRWKNVPFREVLATREIYINELLTSIGASALIDLDITPRLTRKKFKLHIA